MDFIFRSFKISTYFLDLIAALKFLCFWKIYKMFCVVYNSAFNMRVSVEINGRLQLIFNSSF